MQPEIENTASSVETSATASTDIQHNGSNAEHAVDENNGVLTDLVPKIEDEEPDNSFTVETDDANSLKSRKQKATAKSPYHHLNGSAIPAKQPEIKPESDDEFAGELKKADNNYSKVYEKYQEKFSQVYDESKRLFKLEQITRTYMSYLKRRNNGILDVLGELESDELIEEIDAYIAQEEEEYANGDDDNESIFIDKKRIENIITMAPKLKQHLAILMNFSDSCELSPLLKKSVPADLLLDEVIPDLPNDDLRELEMNPQLVESWTRRHYPNLVISKLKPLLFKPYGIVDEFHNLNNLEGTLWKDIASSGGETGSQENESTPVAAKRKRKVADEDTTSSTTKRQK